MATPAESLLRLSRGPTAIAAALAVSLAGCTEDASPPTGPEAGTSPVATTASAAAPLVFLAVSAGDSHTCGVTTDNRAWCWGSNSSGTLGDGTQTTGFQPRPVAGTRRYHNTSASQFYSCALTLAGRGECWGSNPRGELGNGASWAMGRPPARRRPGSWPAI
jgi:alpha-tubulin suppressor-like RCC1 family protein